MKYTEDEANYFYWHCTTAALLIEQLEKNTATCSHIQRAVRMASETAVGKNGVQYASHEAYQQKLASKKNWSGLGLTREHVVPVSVITKKVLVAHESGIVYSWRELIGSLTQDDLRNWMVIDSDYFLGKAAPLSAVIASVIRRSAIFAWITKDDDKELRKKGVTKTMPPNQEDNELARYTFCGIKLVSLLSAAEA
jgi:hypothetical protein